MPSPHFRLLHVTSICFPHSLNQSLLERFTTRARQFCKIVSTQQTGSLLTKQNIWGCFWVNKFYWLDSLISWQNDPNHVSILKTRLQTTRTNPPCVRQRNFVSGRKGSWDRHSTGPCKIACCRHGNDLPICHGWYWLFDTYLYKRLNHPKTQENWSQWELQSCDWYANHSQSAWSRKWVVWEYMDRIGSKIYPNPMGLRVW